MEPPLAQAVDKLAQAGHRSITIAPLFMAQGGHLKHDVPRLIEFLSGSTTLVPGTVILTGTPQGVGMAAKPQPRWP